MKAILIKTNIRNIGGVPLNFGNTLKVVDIEPKLEAYYDILRCSMIQFAERSVGGRVFDFICDEEVFIEGKPFVYTCMSATDDEYNIVNDVLICHTNDEGDEVSLTDDDIKLIKSKFDTINYVLEID